MKRAEPNKKGTNVLFINHSIRDGGPGKSLFYILKYLDRKRVNPYVLIPKDDIFSDNLRTENLYENIIVDRRFPENLFRPVIESSITGDLSERNYIIRKSLRFIYAIINVLLMAHLIIRSGPLLRANEIDIIYCNGTIAKVVGALIGGLNNCSVIWHVRNIQQTKFLSYIINRLSRFDSVKKIICVSEATARQFRYSHEKIRIIYNGLDPEEYDPAGTEGVLREEYGIPSDTVIVGSTGRIVPRKGYEEFIRHTISIFDKSDKKIIFVIIGDTPHFFHIDYIGKLKKIASEMGLEDKFIFTGYKKEIHPYLRDMDIFFIPSNYPDPFPRSVIEAMSYALPVTGFRIGGIAESFEHGISGFHSEPGDYENMIENIRTLVEDRDLRRKMGMEARNRVCNNFQAKDISANIQDVILEVV